MSRSRDVIMTDRFGAQHMTVAGLIALAIGSVMLSAMPAALGIPGYVAPLAVITAGYALFQTANNTGVMTDVPATGAATSPACSTCRAIWALVTGTSVMGAVFALASGAADIATAQPEAVATGMRITFAVAGGADGRRAGHRDDEQNASRQGTLKFDTCSERKGRRPEGGGEVG
jgi:hypothetical protein